MLVGPRFQPASSHSRSSAALDDRQLMARLQTGDVTAFEAMYDRHSRAVHGLAVRMLHDDPGAEEVTQDAFLSLWRSREAYAPGRGAPRTWLLSIARNRAIDAIRRRRPDAPSPFELEADGLEAPERTEDDVMRRADADAMARALRLLPEHQRRVLDLAYFGGFSQTEIATRLELPLGTVKGRMRLGLQKLAADLAPPAPALT